MDELQKRAFSGSADIISSFFVNRYFNEIYAMAKREFERGQSLSLTHVYVSHMRKYLTELRDSTQQSQIRDTINAVREYYSRYTSEITINDLISRVTSQIVPDEYIKSASASERSAIFCDVIRQMAIDIGQAVLKPENLRVFIDDRGKSKIVIESLRMRGVNAMRDFHESLVTKLYSADTNVSKRVVAAEKFEKIGAELKKALAASTRAEIQNARDAEAISKRDSELAEYRKSIEESARNLTAMKQAYATIKQELQSAMERERNAVARVESLQRELDDVRRAIHTGGETADAPRVVRSGGETADAPREEHSDDESDDAKQAEVETPVKTRERVKRRASVTDSKLMQHSDDERVSEGGRDQFYGSFASVALWD